MTAPLSPREGTRVIAAPVRHASGGASPHAALGQWTIGSGATSPRGGPGQLRQAKSGCTSDPSILRQASARTPMNLVPEIKLAQTEALQPWPDFNQGGKAVEEAEVGITPQSSRYQSQTSQFEASLAELSTTCKSNVASLRALEEQLRKQQLRLVILEVEQAKITSKSPEHVDELTVKDSREDAAEPNRMLTARSEQKLEALSEQCREGEYQVQRLRAAFSKQTAVNEEVHRQLDSLTQLQEQSFQHLANTCLKELDKIPKLATRLQVLESKEWQRSMTLKPQEALKPPEPLEEGQLQCIAQLKSMPDSQTIESRVEQLEAIVGMNSINSTMKDVSWLNSETRATLQQFKFLTTQTCLTRIEAPSDAYAEYSHLGTGALEENPDSVGNVAALTCPTSAAQRLLKGSERGTPLAAIAENVSFNEESGMDVSSLNIEDGKLKLEEVLSEALKLSKRSS